MSHSTTNKCCAMWCNSSGSFYVKWTKKMEKSTHHLRFSSHFI